MSIRNYVDNAAAKTVPAGCNSSTTSIIVNSTSSLPTVPFTATLDRATASAEQVLVTGAVGTTLTVTRNHGGTGAFSHAAGCAFEHTVDAIDMREANTHVNATSGAHGVIGNIVGDSDAQTLSNKTLSGVVGATINGATFSQGLISGKLNAWAASDSTALTTAYAASGTSPGAGAIAWLDSPTPGIYAWTGGTTWVPVSLAAGLTVIASGTLSITPSAANTPTSGAVTFPTGRFGSATPVVTVAINGTVPGTVITGCAVSGITSSGCTLWVTRTNTTATTLSWIATVTT